MNLAAGSVWGLVTASGQWGVMPTDRLNANRDIVDLRSGENAVRMLTKPTKALRGSSVDIICRWNGSGTVSASGVPVRNVRVSGNKLTFTYAIVADDNAHVVIKNLIPSDPVRDVDCRETDADPNAMFDPVFMSEVKRYSVLRFMKWNQAVESNVVVTWADRNKPGQGSFAGPDGVPIEYMIQLANEAGSDPWFAIPWNADDEYIRKFAELVRDRLHPSRKAYVEVSNEVWNYAYPVTGQAASEGMAAGLSTNSHEAMLRRYAQKTGSVMDVWSSVFAGQMHRIVRVAAIQTGAWGAEKVLDFDQTASKVDALASAPYFYKDMTPGMITTSASLDQYFKDLGADMLVRIKYAKDTKAAATRFGVRYITYEAGQHVTSPQDVTQLDRVQRDPRMGQLYTTYLTSWKDQIGDLMVLFQDYGGAGKYGAFGQKDYVGQPLSEAPKENAVELFRQSYVR